MDREHFKRRASVIVVLRGSVIVAASAGALQSIEMKWSIRTQHFLHCVCDLL